MKAAKIAVFILLFIICSVSGLFAQGTTPAWEIHGGYQFTRLDIGAVQNAADLGTTALGLPRVDVGNGLNMNGWTASVAENKTGWFGGVLDFSGSYANKNIDVSRQAVLLGLVPAGTTLVAGFKPSLYTYAGGPQFAYRKSRRYQPLVHVLFGAAHVGLAPQPATRTVLTALAPTFNTSDTAFALLAGGAVDFPFHQGQLAFRAQGDYLRSYLFNQFVNEQSSFRVSGGLVLRLGNR